MTQVDIQKICVRLIKLCRGGDVWFGLVFYSKYNISVLGVASGPTKYPSHTLMGKKVSQKAHMPNLVAKREFE